MVANVSVHCVLSYLVSVVRIVLVVVMSVVVSVRRRVLVVAVCAAKFVV